jgi:2-keto-4-pentenoate hydratase/2-oxohepta-3-ene-1,7-dioic acid hydratase in catechol pathway
MADYRLVTYRAPDGARAGVVVDETVFDAAALTGERSHASMLGILESWGKARGAIERAIAKPSRRKGVPLRRAKLLTPVMWPGAVFCAGANYTDHVVEMARVQNIAPEPDPHEVGLSPWHFLKASRAVAHPGARLKLPAYSKMVDWEAELAAVIGRTARDVPVEKALGYVAGYTVANDLSARDFTKRPHVADGSPFKYDWLAQKNFDASCPIGPWIVPAKAIRDPQNLGIKLSVNGVVKQDSNTSQMIFTLAEQIAHLSTRLTLHPGDIVLTGTPAGVGLARREFLKPGDEVTVWIEKVGTLTNTFV